MQILIHIFIALSEFPRTTRCSILLISFHYSLFYYNLCNFQLRPIYCTLKLPQIFFILEGLVSRNINFCFAKLSRNTHQKHSIS